MRKCIRLFARVPNGEGGYGFDMVATDKKGKPRPPEGATAYYLRYTEGGKRRMEPVGDIFEEAYTAFLNKEAVLEYVKRGLPVPENVKSDRGVTIADAAEQFVKNQSALGKAPSTVYGYTRAVEQFRDSCGRIYMCDVGRQEVIEHISWIRENIPTRATGEQNGTIRTRLQYLVRFFSENSLKFPLPMREWPKVEGRNPEAYTTEQISALLS